MLKSFTLKRERETKGFVDRNNNDDSHMSDITLTVVSKVHASNAYLGTSLFRFKKKRKRKLDEKKDEALVSIGSGYPIDSDLWIDS